MTDPKISSGGSISGEERPAGMTAKQGTWPLDCVQRAFVDGAAWWEFQSSDATMWPSDRTHAETEAVRRFGEPVPAVPPPEMVEALQDFEIAAQAWEYSSEPHEALKAKLDAARSKLEQLFRELRGEVERLRTIRSDSPDYQALLATNRRLNRRVQSAEAGLAEKINANAGQSFGRILANSAATMYAAQRDDAYDLLKSLEGEVSYEGWEIVKNFLGFRSISSTPAPKEASNG